MKISNNAVSQNNPQILKKFVSEEFAYPAVGKTPAYKRKVEVQLKPKLDKEIKPDESFTAKNGEYIRKIQREIAESSQKAREYLRSLRFESYTVSFVKGKGVVVKGINKTPGFNAFR